MKEFFYEYTEKCPFLLFPIHSYQKGMEYLPKAIALEKNIFNFFLRNSEFGKLGLHSRWKDKAIGISSF